MTKDEIVEKAKAAYTKSTYKDPTVSCYSFPTWEDLSKEVQQLWVERAELLFGDRKPNY